MESNYLFGTSRFTSEFLLVTFILRLHNEPSSISLIVTSGHGHVGIFGIDDSLAFIVQPFIVSTN